MWSRKKMKKKRKTIKWNKMEKVQEMKKERRGCEEVKKSQLKTKCINNFLGVEVETHNYS